MKGMVNSVITSITLLVAAAYSGSDWILFFIPESYWSHRTPYSFPRSFWSFLNSVLNSFASISFYLCSYNNALMWSIPVGSDVRIRATRLSLSDNVMSLPNLVVAYPMNFYLLFRKVSFVVEPVMNICSFNSSVLFMYDDTTVTVVFPPLFFFLCLAFLLFSTHCCWTWVHQGYLILFYLPLLLFKIRDHSLYFVRVSDKSLFL